MRVLSLFDGISCGRVALERAGVKITEYFASEIDPYAIRISSSNYPDTHHLGDIKDFYSWGIPTPDLIIGGSPCQGFSFAGKQLAFQDTRSSLLFKFVEILGYYNPKFFLLENVKMKKECLEAVTCMLGVPPICINSALVSAQNRVRYYWTNIPDVTQPAERGIVLKDVIEHGEDHWGKRPRVFRVNDNARVKGVNEDSRGYRFHRGDSRSTGISELGRIVKPNGKTDALTTSHAPKIALNTDVSDLLYRKLTPIECERLQTLPDNYTQGVSLTQRYKTLGNGWTVDVVAHIFKNINNC